MSAVRYNKRDKESEDLLERLKRGPRRGAPVQADLRTDERVLARITDGIYRLPSSALRELIANAYDADATKVVVDCDPPRFSQISVRDNGNGMTLEALANLVHHIGGSAKRTSKGADLGVTARGDSSHSPQGRALIGKIGIGLFSVAQLTRHFQIITKRAGDDRRWIADVELKTFSEETVSEAADGSGEVTAGTVKFTSFPAEDRSAHGTEVVLVDLRREARRQLRSAELWHQLGVAESEADEEVERPVYHIGSVDPDDEELIQNDANLPWEHADAAGQRFESLVRAVVAQTGRSSGSPNPKLETTLDGYLRMLWTLSLSLPLKYIGKHPFDVNGDNPVRVFNLDADGGRIAEVKLGARETVRDKLGLQTPVPGEGFSVYVDGIELRRPVVLEGLPRTTGAVQEALLFVGRVDADLTPFGRDASGGDRLRLEAYFLLQPKVVPQEHIGTLVRINDASGTLYDETFFRYRIAETTRLRKITAETFVDAGLEAALNIDRESFNFAHPHYVYLMRWTHNQLRRIATKHKELESHERAVRRDRENRDAATRVEKILRQYAREAAHDDDYEPPTVELLEDPEEAEERRMTGSIALLADDVEKHYLNHDAATKPTAPERNATAKAERAARLTLQVLHAFGLLEDLPYDRQAELLAALTDVLKGVME